ncbi:MAG: hypothetical protein IIY21_11020 [Clostridiales bacterium]|nr:hypothetical protein [Clostridiales bacterium]
MMGEYEKTICELFDNNPSNYQIKAIAGMYKIDIEEVKRILLDNGRDLPKAGRPKLTTKSDPDSDEQKSEKAAGDKAQQIPDAVKNLVFDRINKLDSDLGVLNQRISDLEDAKAAVVGEYKILADFISVPFGAGNLSQNESSENMLASPQADA